MQIQDDVRARGTKEYEHVPRDIGDSMTFKSALLIRMKSAA